MKIVRFQFNEERSYGILQNSKIYQIEDFNYKQIKKTGEEYNIKDVKLLTPCKPTKIFGIGLNFPEHIRELNVDFPEKPAGFLKPLSSIINPFEKIIIPQVAERVDYEGEIAVVIKNEIKNISEEEAAEHIFGVTPFNDLTERELSYTPSLVTYSKAFDTFTCFGPVIETDFDLDNITVKTYLNDEKVQEGNSGDMLFSPAYLVSFLSKCMTLYPGDIITTGTPRNVLGLNDGDKVEVELDCINQRLINYVSALN